MAIIESKFQLLMTDQKEKEVVSDERTPNHAALRLLELVDKDIYRPSIQKTAFKTPLRIGKTRLVFQGV